MSFTNNQKKFIIFNKIKNIKNINVCKCDKQYWIDLMNDLTPIQEITDFIEYLDNHNDYPYSKLTKILSKVNQVDLDKLFEIFKLL